MGSIVLDKKDTMFAYNNAANRQYLGCHSASRDVYIGPNSAVVGDVFIKSPVFIGFNSMIKAYTGSSLFIGAYTSIHDNCQIYGLNSPNIKIQNKSWGIYIDGEVSILHSSTIDGYCRIGKNTFIGQNVSISNAQIRPNCVIMHGAKITDGIIIPEGRFIKSGMNLFNQREADKLPKVPREYLSLNPDTIKGYMELMGEYLSTPQTLSK